jgi:hypothetical protein
LPTIIAVDRPCVRASAKIVGALMNPRSGRTEFQSILWAAMSTPESIDACDGSVSLREIVDARRAMAPAFASFTARGITALVIASARRPSTLMITTRGRTFSAPAKVTRPSKHVVDKSARIAQP